MSTARSPIRSIVRATTTIRSPHSRKSGSAITSTSRSTKRRLARRVSSSSPPRRSAPARARRALDEAAVGAVDQLVELHEAFRAGKVTLRERVERDAQHLFGPLTHLGEHVDERRVGIGVGDELRQLRYRDASVRTAFEQEIDVE